MKALKSTITRQDLQRQHERWLRQRALETSAAALRRPLDLGCLGSDQQDLEHIGARSTEGGAVEGRHQGAAVTVDSPSAQRAGVEHAVGVVSHLGGAAARRVTQQLRHELQLGDPGVHALGMGEHLATKAVCVRCNSHLLVTDEVHTGDTKASQDVPMLLVPCGHSLCARCSDQTSSEILFKCPGCRCGVEGRVVNRPLMQLIAACGQRSSFSNAAAVDHHRIAGLDAQLSLRIKLFEDEQCSADTDLALLEDRCRAAACQLQRLTAEEDSLSKAECSIAELCRDHEKELAEAQKTATELEAQAVSCETLAAMLEATLANLRRDRAKCQLMVEHFGPRELLDDLVEA